MRPSHGYPMRWVALVLLFGIVSVPPPVTAQERPASQWGTGAHKSYVIPALEVGAFNLGLNAFDRAFVEDKTYDTDWESFWKNLGTAPVFDKDPFKINQIGHPYQGSVSYGLARSAGLGYWESLGYGLGSSFVWETAGETTPPSINDYVTTTVGGSFVGEAMFRMANLLLEGGGETPGLWREVGAAVLSPSTGFNRLAFGDRFRPVYPSRDPAVFTRLRLGATLTTDVDTGGLSGKAQRQEGSADFSLAYGLPGKPGYRYDRPFDYFLFEFTGVPNARTAASAIENVTVRGLLAGTRYEVGDDYRGLWGLFGSYEYLSPQVFSLAATNLALGTVAQWWLARRVALQGTVLGGAGFGAAGTVGDREERDYRYGVIPNALVNLRLILADRVMLEAHGRQYWVVGIGSSASPLAQRFGHEVIDRANVSVSVRLFGPHALSLQYRISSREAHVEGRGDREQAVQTVTLSYDLLGSERFGALEWR
jgi:hypothetical protein